MFFVHKGFLHVYINHCVWGSWCLRVHFCPNPPTYAVTSETHTYRRRFEARDAVTAPIILMCCGVVLACEWLISNTGICSRGSSESPCHLYFWGPTPHQQPVCRVIKQSSHVSGPADRNTERVYWPTRSWIHQYRQTHGVSLDAALQSFDTSTVLIFILIVLPVASCPLISASNLQEMCQNKKW